MIRSYRNYAINFAAITSVGVFVSFLMLNKMSPLGLSKDQNRFIGCYYYSGNVINIEPDGKMMISGYQGARYQIVSPVPGKHGFLIKVYPVDLSYDKEKIIAKDGSDGFLWPVSDNGILSVAFAPDFVNDFSKGRCD
jgi:hypothetical protein